MVLRGNGLEMKLGLVFWLNLNSNHLRMTKRYPHSKEGQYIYSNQLKNIEAIIVWFFWEALQFEAMVPQTVHLRHGFTHQHMLD